MKTWGPILPRETFFPVNEGKDFDRWTGTERAMMKNHPDKFSKEACKDDYDGDKMCPYAVSASMEKKGHEPHYKKQKTSKSGEPKKKEKYKDENKKKDEHTLWGSWLERKRNCCDACKRGEIHKCKCKELKESWKDLASNLALATGIGASVLSGDAGDFAKRGDIRTHSPPSATAEQIPTLNVPRSISVKASGVKIEDLQIHGVSNLRGGTTTQYWAALPFANAPAARTLAATFMKNKDNIDFKSVLEVDKGKSMTSHDLPKKFHVKLHKYTVVLNKEGLMVDVDAELTVTIEEGGEGTMKTPNPYPESTQNDIIDPKTKARVMKELNRVLSQHPAILRVVLKAREEEGGVK